MSDSNLLPIIMIGGGGHASVLADILLSQNRTILAVISPDEINQRRVFTGISRLQNDKDINQFDPNEVKLVNGIGMMPKSKFKKQINEWFQVRGYQFETVISSDAKVSSFASIGIGAQVLSGAIVQTGAAIGDHTTINTGALVEHDCRIGSYNHIAPRATLCGQVTTASGVYIGASSTVIQDLTLAEDSIVASGATVVEPLAVREIAYPARTIKK